MISSPLIPPFNFRQESLFAHPLSLGQIPMKGHHSASVSVLMVQDAQWLDVLNSINIPPDSQAAAIISYLYPNTQGLGIPSLATSPWVIPPNSNCSSQLGSQFRRMTSFFGAQSSSHQEEQPTKHGQRTKSPATATASTSSSTESLPAWAQPISKKLHSSSTSAAKGTVHRQPI